MGGDTFPKFGGEIDEGEFHNQGIIDLLDGFIPDKLWASNGRLSGDTGVENISNAINNGAGFVVFSGHGLQNEWGTHPHKNSDVWLPGPDGQYLNTHVSGLLNGDKLPIVVLNACSTCMYYLPTCFGWSFVSNPNGGGIGSYGATVDAYAEGGTDHNQGLFGGITYNIIDAYKNQGAKTFGEMWSNAVTNYIHPSMYNMDIRTIVEFQPFGDPTLAVAEESTSPSKPDTPTGPSSGEINEEHTYTTFSTDADGDGLYYRFSWGNDEYSEWIGPYNPGETASASHIWTLEGDYEVKVIAKDSNGVISEWSDPLPISMPKNKAISIPFLKFLENHPHLFPLLRQLLGLEV